MPQERGSQPSHGPACLDASAQRESDTAGWAPGGCVPGRAAGPPRRRCLPAASGPGADVSLWNILRNNIGKDLSKVSMPVQLNEPLNTLQRLCEELEYSSLLDQASRITDPCERMVPAPPTPGPAPDYHFLPWAPVFQKILAGVFLAAEIPPQHPSPSLRWGGISFSDPSSSVSLAFLPQVYIAAFAVSAYSSTYHRAGCKPFNPVLGETYECERPDRGFRFISEQVSPGRRELASWWLGRGMEREQGAASSVPGTVPHVEVQSTLLEGATPLSTGA